jgi:hypothetical protein
MRVKYHVSRQNSLHELQARDIAEAPHGRFRPVSSGHELVLILTHSAQESHKSHALLTIQPYNALIFGRQDHCDG